METQSTPSKRPATTSQARSLRRRATIAERALWKLLRDRRMAGLKFRRQVPVGPYVLDFVCLEHRLIVEADGPFHDPAEDAIRDAWLAAQGFRTLRLPNRIILGGQARDLILDSLLPSREKVSAKLTDEGP